MAQLNDLIVNGYSRFLNSAYGNLNGSATSALCAAYAASTNTAIKVNSATSATSAYDVINKAIKVNSATSATSAYDVINKAINVNSAGSAAKAASATSALSAGSAAKAAELTNKAIKVNSAGTADYATSAGAAPVASHTHGNMESTFVKTLPNTSSTTWSSQFGVLNNGFWLYSIRAQGTVPAWFAAGYGAGIAFGGGDTKGVVSMDWNTPYIKFACGPGKNSAGEPKWWFSFSGTAGKKYTLPGADSTLAAINGSYSGTNGLTALSARGAYSATNASTAANATNAGTANVANAVNLTGEWTSNVDRYIWFGTNGTAASAGWDSSLRYNPSSNTLSSTNISSTSITGVSISATNITATTFSGNLSGSAASAKNAEWARSADYLNGYVAGNFAFLDGNYSSVGGLTAKSARGAYSASTANYSNSTNTAIKVNSAIYLQDYSDSAEFARISWRSPDIKQVSTTGGQTSANTKYIAAWCVIDGSPVIKAVDVTFAGVASADKATNADKVDGLHFVTGSIGTAANTIYFC